VAELAGDDLADDRSGAARPAAGPGPDGDGGDGQPDPQGVEAQARADGDGGASQPDTEGVGAEAQVGRDGGAGQPADPEDVEDEAEADRDGGGRPAGWPGGLISARSALERGLPGWPRPGEQPPGPPVPLPPGRGGQQRIPRPFNARAGGPPPWADVVAGPGRWGPSLTDLRAALAALGPPLPSLIERRPGRVRASAVLAPLYEEHGELVVVLTRRTWGLRTHQGEVSFPGGRVEPGESPADAARREAKEEIDLDPSTVELIGELDHLTAVSSESYVVPYVGALPRRPDRRPNPIEVDAVLDVPLRELADPAIFREEIWTFPGGFDRPIYFFELVGDTVWGMTAAMLRQLLGILTGTLGRGDLGH
jgi:8-oxo-dGTP pyrophosphatase MutT (NUDIX family)